MHFVERHHVLHSWLNSQRPAVAEGPLALKLVLFLGVFGGGGGEVVAPHVVVLEGMYG